MTLETAKVPEPFVPLFEQAEKVVRKYFESMEMDPTKGVINIAGDRYILMRGESVSTMFIDHMRTVMGEEQALNFLYGFAKVIGKSDAKAFHEKMDLKDPVHKLSAGPVHFSFSGWAFVDIHADSNPSPDENFFLKYDHPNTFEAVSYLKQGREIDHPVCVFSAGYSAGWCSESFGIELDAREVLCRAKGDDVCHFLMAPPLKMDQYVKEFGEQQ